MKTIKGFKLFLKKCRCKSALIGAVIFLLLMSIPPISLAFSYSGIRWWSPTAYVKYDSSVPSSWQTSGALYNARSAWNKAGSRFRLYYDSSSDNVVKAGSYGNTDWVARVRVYYNWLGYITQAELVFNRSYPWSTSGVSGYYDVQNVATHEFGHWLQLKDLYSSSDFYKTMYGYTETGETYKRTLHPDDVAGIKYIYGTD